jgi:large subunit ribosomal protein L28
MAKACDICGKTKVFGNNVSHSHLKTRRTWKPNFQTVRKNIQGAATKLTVCSSCLKANKV